MPASLSEQIAKSVKDGIEKGMAEVLKEQGKKKKQPEVVDLLDDESVSYLCLIRPYMHTLSTRP